MMPAKPSRCVYNFTCWLNFSIGKILRVRVVRVGCEEGIYVSHTAFRSVNQ